MRSTRIFRNGNSQAVRLPKEFHVASGEVFISREGDAIVLRPFPAEPVGLLPALRSLDAQLGTVRPDDPVPHDPEHLSARETSIP